MIRQCMCMCTISVALTVVLEGKFESERPDCTPNYFNNPKPNTAVNKAINVVYLVSFIWA